MSSTTQLAQVVAKACSVLRAVAAAQLFDHFQPEDAEAAAQRLVSLVFNKEGDEGREGPLPACSAAASEVISALGQVLPTSRPTLQLVVQATVVRDVNVGEDGGGGAWEKGGAEEHMLGSSNDSEEGDSGIGGVPDQPNIREQNNPLASSSDDPHAMGDQLLQLLEAREALRPRLRKAAAKLGPEAAWHLLLEVQQRMRAQQQAGEEAGMANSGGADVDAEQAGPAADSGASLTAGPLFLKLAKDRQGPQTLCTTQQLQATPPAPFVLRGYQQRAVDAVLRGGGNWVVAAPTNSGKTAIFIEMSRLLLSHNPMAKVLVLAPAVSLVRQHCNSFAATGSFRSAMEDPRGKQGVPVIDWFCGDKPLAQGTWPAELSRLGVMVLESRSFLNLLEEGQAQLEDADLLVLDECHHTDKLHPYAVIMSHYNSLPPENRPQVLGFSASPASGTTEDRVMQRLSRLLRSLHAHLHVISEEDVAQQQVVSTAMEGEEYVPAREQDFHMASWVKGCIGAMASCIGRSLQVPPIPASQRQGQPPFCARQNPPPPPHKSQGTAVTTAAATAAAAAAVQGLKDGLRVVEATRGTQPAVHFLNLLCGWMSKAMEVARTWSMMDLAGCLQFLEVLRRTAALSEDMGYECGLQYAAQHIVDLAMAHTSWAKHQQGTVRQTHDQQQHQQQCWGSLNVLQLCRQFLEQLEEWAATLGFGSGPPTAGGPAWPRASRPGAAATAAAAAVGGGGPAPPGARASGSAAAGAAAHAPSSMQPCSKVLLQDDGRAVPQLALLEGDLGSLAKRRRLGTMGERFDHHLQRQQQQQQQQQGGRPQQRGMGDRCTDKEWHEGGHGMGLLHRSAASLPSLTHQQASAAPMHAPVLSSVAAGAGAAAAPTPTGSSTAAAAAGLVHCALAPVLPASLEPAPAAHPKLWALLQYLLDFQDRETFHGIIFSRTRHGAYYLAEVLRMAMSAPASMATLRALGCEDRPCLSPRTKAGSRGAAASGPCLSPHARANGAVEAASPLLGFIQDVHVFVGHGGQGPDKSRLLLPSEGMGTAAGATSAAVPGGTGGDWATASGMTIYQQQAVLDAFKVGTRCKGESGPVLGCQAPGRRILVATNAAEEGLDVPCCEFVVRFSPPATGVQRVQARGRSRKLGAQYMCLIQMHTGAQRGGSDAALQGKSDAEEAALRRVLSKVAKNKHVAVA